MSRAARAVAMATVILALAGMAQTAAAIDAPQWVAALYVEAQKVVGLRWSPVAGATAYKVLRSTAQGKDYKELITVTAPQYFDKDLEPGTTYYYVLQAVGAGTEVSANSAEKTVVIPGQKKVEVVTPPEWDKITLSETTEFGKVSFKVGLFWRKSASPNVVAYNLYRTTASGKDYQLVGSVSDTKYVDAAVEEGKTYYYVVSALDNQFQETPYSAEKSLAVARTVKAETKKVEKSLAMVTRGTKDLYRLEVKNYPIDITLMPGGQLAVACGYLVIFPSTEEGTEAQDISGNLTDWTAVSVNNDGDLIAVSTMNGFKIFSPEGRLKKEVKVEPTTADTILDFGEEKFKAKLAYFSGAAQAPDGRYYLSDNNNHRVLIFSENGKYEGMFNEGKPVGRIVNPSRIRITADGTRYITSFGRSAYLIFDPKDNLLRTVGEMGQQVGTFGKIQGMSMDGKGFVYVADMQNGNIQVFNAAGDFQFLLADEAEKGNIHVALISGIAVTPDGKRLYAAESMNKTIAVLEIPPKK